MWSNQIVQVLLFLLPLANGGFTFTHRGQQEILNPELGLYNLCDLTALGATYVRCRTEYRITVQSPFAVKMG